MVYLGIKFAVRRLTSSDFRIMLEKAASKLNVWGNRFFSLAGILVLIRSVISRIPIFSITYSLVPSNILIELDKMCRDFLWNKVWWLP